MQDAPLVLGIDLGTSGVRVAVINADRELLHTQAIGYAGGIHRPEDWLEACRSLLHSIPGPLRHCLRALAVDGDIRHPAGLRPTRCTPDRGAQLCPGIPGTWPTHP